MKLFGRRIVIADKKKFAICLAVFIVVLLVVFITMICLSGKSNSTEESTPEATIAEDEIIQEDEVEEEEVDTEHEGMMKSYLTGQWVDEEVGTARAVAIMFGNTKDPLPHYGITYASVTYEAPVEGGITRLMGIFEDVIGLNLDQIGGIRSCRPYYAYFAMEFDAIYFHVGNSVNANEILESGLVDNVNGTLGTQSKYFFRTDEHAAPHNDYTSSALIADAIEGNGYSSTYDEDYDGHYVFAEDDEINTLEDGEDVSYIKLYYFNNKPYFVYNEDSCTYFRYQFGEAHVDAIDGVQVEVTNIIFQNVSSEIFMETEYLTLGIDTSGAGKFFTHGKMVDITWVKESDGITHYYYENGEEIVLNQGKTWVCIIQNSYADSSTFSDTIPDDITL